ncbi:lysophospholipid acyltransferase family protein [Lacimonas salitolerans]|uniref:Lysophospholipid acyltransferase family protein n=1 Tax=Lacimonas salitolerans TaxID=1323750 RepID=A0ABW4EE82_9RHOB
MIVQWIKSLIFLIYIYLAMVVLGLVFLPWAAVQPMGARMACRTYARHTLWLAGWFLGLRHEVRGEVPTDEVLIAAKHQSFMDILIIFLYAPTAKFIMKRELLWTPVIGLFAWRLGCVPVDRGKRGAAIARMIEDVEKGRAQPGQLIIYSQGTRVKPGVRAPYKVGTAVLYQQLGQPCVPAATNAGLFWPRSGVLRKPGLAVVEFLPRIEPGMSRNDFMQHLEIEVEAASDRLMAEAGFVPKG